MKLVDLLIEGEFALCGGEAKRLIQGGGVNIDKQLVTDVDFVLTKTSHLVVGKNKRVLYIATNKEKK